MVPIVGALQILNGLLTMVPVAEQTVIDIKRIFTKDPVVEDALKKVIADTISTDEKAKAQAQAWLDAHGG